MKRTVSQTSTTCDRCGQSDGGHYDRNDWSTAQVQKDRKNRRSTVDLCAGCTADFKEWLGAP